MALPRQIPNTVLLEEGFNPPHLNGSVVYVVGYGGFGLEVTRSVNPDTAGFSEQDSANAPVIQSGSFDGISSSFDGSSIHIAAWYTSAGSTRHYVYAEFDTTTNSWVTTGTLSSVEQMTSAVHYLWAHVVARSDGDLIYVYNGETDRVMGGEKSRVDYYVSTDGGSTWGTSNALDAAGDIHYGHPINAMGPNNDECHIIWCKQTSTAADPPTQWTTVEGRTLDSAGSLSTTITGATGHGYALKGFGGVVSYTDSSDRIALAGSEQAQVTGTTSPALGTSTEDASGDIQSITDRQLLTTDDPYVTSDTIERGVSTIAVDESNGDLYYVYAGGGTDGVDQDIYYSKSTSAGSLWDSPIELVDGISCTWLGAVVGDHGGGTVLAYIYSVGTTQYYNELSLSATVTATGTITFSGALTAAGYSEVTATGTSTITGDLAGVGGAYVFAVGTSTITGDLAGVGTSLASGTSTFIGDLAGIGQSFVFAAGTITITGDVVSRGTSLARGTITALGDVVSYATKLSAATTSFIGQLIAGGGTQFATGTSTATGDLSAIGTQLGGLVTAAGTITVTGDLVSDGKSLAAGTITATGDLVAAGYSEVNATATILWGGGSGTWSYVGGDDNQGNSATTVSITHNQTILSGDLVVVYINSNVDETHTPQQAGWTTEIDERPNEGGVEETCRSILAWRIAGASEPATYTWTHSTAANYGVTIKVFRPSAGTPTVDAAATSDYSGTATTYNDLVLEAQSGVSIGADAVSVVAGGKDNRSGTGAYTSATNSYVSTLGASGSDQCVGMAHRIDTGSGFTAPSTVTLTGGTQQSDSVFSVHQSWVAGGGERLTAVGTSLAFGTSTSTGDLVAGGGTQFALGTITATGDLAAIGTDVSAGVVNALGTITFSATLVTGGGTQFALGTSTFSADVAASGTGIVFASGTVTCTGDLVAAGTNLARGTITAIGEAIGYGTKNAFGTITVTGDLVTGGGTQFALGTSTITGDLVVGGGTQFAQGTSTSTGDLTATGTSIRFAVGTITVTGDLVTGGGTQFAFGTSTFTGDLAAVGADISVTSAVGTITVTGDLTTGGGTQFAFGTITAIGTSIGDGIQLATGTSTFSGDLAAIGSILSPPISATGTITFSGEISEARTRIVYDGTPVVITRRSNVATGAANFAFGGWVFPIDATADRGHCKVAVRDDAGDTILHDDEFDANANTFGHYYTLALDYIDGDFFDNGVAGYTTQDDDYGVCYNDGNGGRWNCAQNQKLYRQVRMGIRFIRSTSDTESICPSGTVIQYERVFTLEWLTGGLEIAKAKQNPVTVSGSLSASGSVGAVSATGLINVGGVATSAEGFVTLRSAGPVWDNVTAGGASEDLTKPVNIVAGDLLIVNIVGTFQCDGHAQAGWTAVYVADENFSSYWRWATGDANDDFTMAATSTSAIAAQMVCFDTRNGYYDRETQVQGGSAFRNDFSVGTDWHAPSVSAYSTNDKLLTISLSSKHVNATVADVAPSDGIPPYIGSAADEVDNLGGFNINGVGNNPSFARTSWFLFSYFVNDDADAPAISPYANNLHVESPDSNGFMNGYTYRLRLWNDAYGVGNGGFHPGYVPGGGGASDGGDLTARGTSLAKATINLSSYAPNARGTNKGLCNLRSATIKIHGTLTAFEDPSDNVAPITASIGIHATLGARLEHYTDGGNFLARGTITFKGNMPQAYLGKVSCINPTATITVPAAVLSAGFTDPNTLRKTATINVSGSLGVSAIYARAEAITYSASLSAFGRVLADGDGELVSQEADLSVWGMIGAGTINGVYRLLIDEPYGSVTLYNNSQGGFFSTTGGSILKEIRALMIWSPTVSALGSVDQIKFALGTINVTGDLAAAAAPHEVTATTTVTSDLSAGGGTQFAFGTSTFIGDLTALGSEVVSYNLTDQPFIFDIAFGIFSTAQACYKIDADGYAYTKQLNFGPGTYQQVSSDYVDPKSAAGPNLHVRFTRQSGNTASFPTGWNDTSVDRAGCLTQTGVGSKTCQYLVELSDDGGTTVVESCLIALDVQVSDELEP